MGMGPIRSQEADDEFGAAPLSEINVTPLVDVMLVLLVIFMVAAPLMTVGVPVQLPRTQASPVSDPKPPVVVTVGHGGEVFLGEEALGGGPDSAALLRTRIAAAAARDPGMTVHVRADREVPYGRVMALMGEVSA